MQSPSLWERASRASLIQLLMLLIASIRYGDLLDGQKTKALRKLPQDLHISFHIFDAEFQHRQSMSILPSQILIFLHPTPKLTDNVQHWGTYGSLLRLHCLNRTVHKSRSGCQPLVSMAMDGMDIGSRKSGWWCSYPSMRTTKYCSYLHIMARSSNRDASREPPDPSTDNDHVERVSQSHMTIHRFCHTSKCVGFSKSV